MRPVDLDQLLEGMDGWTLDEWEAAFAGDGWQIVVTKPEEVDASDGPPEIADLLEGDVYRIAVTLEPAGTDETGYRTLTKVVLELAERVGGVAEHPESGDLVSFL